MVLVQFAVDDEGQYLGATKNVPVSMHRTMRDLWKGLLVEGLITQVRCSLLNYCYLPKSSQTTSNKIKNYWESWFSLPFALLSSLRSKRF